MIIRQLNLENAKSGVTPSEKKKSSEVLASVGLPPVTAEQTTLYRSLVMRAQFLAQDRADIAETVKSLTRKMKAPNDADVKDLKRLGRYLVRKPRVVCTYEPQRTPKVIKVYTDSDHAGCLLTRKSTTGFVVMMGQHCIKHGSNLPIDHCAELGRKRVLCTRTSIRNWFEHQGAHARLGSRKGIRDLQRQ